jgi:hypothetical protein
MNKGIGESNSTGVESHAELHITAQSGDGLNFFQGGDAAGHGYRAGNAFAQVFYDIQIDAGHGSFPVNAGEEQFRRIGFNRLCRIKQGNAGGGFPAVHDNLITGSITAFSVNGDNHPLPACLLCQGFEERRIDGKSSPGDTRAGISKGAGTDDDLLRPKAHEFTGLFRRSYAAANPAFGLTEQGLHHFKVVSLSHGGIQVDDRDFSVFIEFRGQLFRVITLQHQFRALFKLNDFAVLYIN